MRTAYHEQLDALTAELGEMCGLAGKAMERATQALLQADLALAEQVITDHEQIAAMSVRAEESAFVLLALQAAAILSLTRAGWANPAAVSRSELQRVGYVLEAGTLVRFHLPVDLPAAQDRTSAALCLISGFENLCPHE